MPRSSAQPVNQRIVLVNICFAVLGVTAGQLSSSLFRSKFPINMFVDDNKNTSPNYFDWNRLGGLYSHCKRTYRPNVTSPTTPVETQEPESSTPTNNSNLELDVDFVDVVDEDVDTPDMMQLLPRMLLQLHGQLFVRDRSAKDSNGIKLPRYVNLMDCSVMLFYVAVQTHLKTLMGYRRYLKQIQESYEVLGQLPGKNAALTALFETELNTNLRQHTWGRARYFSSRIIHDLSALVQFLLTFFQQSATNDVLPFIPAFYLDVFLSSIAFFAYTHTTPSPALQKLVGDIGGFLTTAIVSDRIVNPDSKENLLQGISLLLQESWLRKAFESNELAKTQLIPNLLKLYDSQQWVRVTSALMRFWRGSGFGESIHPPSIMDWVDVENSGESSTVFQAAFRDVALGHTASTVSFNTFFNKLVNNLNWAFTEFSVSASDVVALLDAGQTGELPNKSKRTGIMFQLTCCLLRLIEYMCQAVPEMFLRQSQLLNLTRLAEGISLLLSRITYGSSNEMFQRISSTVSASGASVSRPEMLVPIIGILLALNKPEMPNDETTAMEIDQSEPLPFVRCLIDDSAFAPEMWGFLLGDGFSFSPYEASHSQEVIATAKHIVSTLAQAHKATPGPADEQDLCPICWANAVSAVFEPCKHTSCKQCITRHLLNSQECFFCKAKIEKVGDI